MNKIVSSLKSLRLGRVITVFLSAILLFVSTACGGGNVLAKTADQIREDVPSNAITSPYKGGMNDYSDVDPRANTSSAQAKAKGLIDNAERNVIDQTSDVGENTKRILDKKGENARDFGQNLKESSAADKAQDSADDFAKGTKRGFENLKGNTDDAVKGAKSAAETKVSRDIDRTQRAVNNVIEDND